MTQRSSRLAVEIERMQSRKRMYTGLGLTIVAFILIAGFWQSSGMNSGSFGEGLRQFFDLPGEILSVATVKADEFWPNVIRFIPYMVETLNIAFVATLFGGLAAVILSLLATRDLGVPNWVVLITRRMMDVARAFPELVIALFLLFVISGSPIPAMIAIAFHTAGALGKLFSEVNENIDRKPLEGLQATGASWFQRIRYGVLPQVAANWMSYFLLRFEINVRASAILGFVGAGGIGKELSRTIGFGQGFHDETAALLALLFVTIVAVDQLSDYLRSQLGADGGAGQARRDNPRPPLPLQFHTVAQLIAAATAIFFVFHFLNVDLALLDETGVWGDFAVTPGSALYFQPAYPVPGWAAIGFLGLAVLMQIIRIGIMGISFREAGLPLVVCGLTLGFAIWAFFLQTHGFAPLGNELWWLAGEGPEAQTRAFHWARISEGGFVSSHGFPRDTATVLTFILAISALARLRASPPAEVVARNAPPMYQTAAIVGFATQARMTMRVLVNIGLPLIAGAYLVYAHFAFEVAKELEEAQPQRFAELGFDAVAHKVHVVRDNRGGDGITVSIEGSRLSEWATGTGPEWIAFAGEEQATMDLGDGVTVEIDGPVTLLTVPDYGTIRVELVGRDIITTVPDGVYPAWFENFPEKYSPDGRTPYWLRHILVPTKPDWTLNYTDAKFDARPSLGKRIQVSRSKTEIHRYEWGWENFWFAFRSPLAGSSGGELWASIWGGDNTGQILALLSPVIGILLYLVGARMGAAGAGGFFGLVVAIGGFVAATLWFSAHGLAPGCTVEAMARTAVGETVAGCPSNAVYIFFEFWENEAWHHGVTFVALLETMLMAILGTLVAAMVALPLSFAAARMRDGAPAISLARGGRTVIGLGTLFLLIVPVGILAIGFFLSALGAFFGAARLGGVR